MPDYREHTNDRSPGSWGFGPQGGRATLPYLIDGEDLTPEAITDILGSVSDGLDGNGDRIARLNRKLPRTHPKWPWLFASRIESGVGLGAPEYHAVATQDVEAPALLDHYAEYPQYLLGILFEPRPYPVLPDEAIVTDDEITWYDEDDTEQTTTYAGEWNRFTSYTIHPRVELLTANQGQMVFRQSDSATAISEGAGAPHLVPYPGHPRMRVGQNLWKIKWHQVPLRFIESPNSFIVRWQGYINQLDWWGFSAGSLLFDSVETSEPYVPAVPELVKLADWADFSSYKLVDIIFNMLQCSRTNGGTAPTLDNRNFIAAGWNLQPWARDRKFYYATTASPPGTTDVSELWKPTFPSAPFQLLFTDPDLS